MSYSAKCELARNINTTSEVLDELSKHKSFYIKWLVSNNPNTSTDTIKYLASLEDEQINISLIRDASFVDYKTKRYYRQNIPGNIAYLVYRKHFSQMFKSYFVSCNKIDQNLLIQIYNEENQDICVIRNIIINSRCPEHIIQNEFNNPGNYSLYYPIKDEGRINYIKRHIKNRINLYIAKVTKDINIIKSCFTYSGEKYYTESLRRSVYSNPNCPDDIMKYGMYNDPCDYNKKYAKETYYKCLQ